MDFRLAAFALGLSGCFYVKPAWQPPPPAYHSCIGLCMICAATNDPESCDATAVVQVGNVDGLESLACFDGAIEPDAADDFCGKLVEQQCEDVALLNGSAVLNHSGVSNGATDIECLPEDVFTDPPVDHQATTLHIDPQHSRLTLTSFGVQGQVEVSGALQFRTFQQFGSQKPTLLPYGFIEAPRLEMLGQAFENGRAVVRSPVAGSEISPGQFLFPAEDLNLVLSGVLIDGVSSQELGELTFATGYFEVQVDDVGETWSGTLALSDASGSIDLSLAGNIAGRPPVAAFSSTTDGCSLQLDASPSFDPDGSDITQWLWTVDGVQAGVGEHLTWNGPSGAHQVQLMVVDQDGAWGFASEEVLFTPTSSDIYIETVTVAPECLWPPNHRYARLDVGENILVDVAGECGSDVTVTIVDAYSNQPDDDLGDGSTVDDALHGDQFVCLRSERSGTEAERIYTIVVEARDASGNVVTDSATVRVPHNRGGGCESDVELLDADDPRCEVPPQAQPPSSCNAVAISGLPLGLATLLLPFALARRRRE